MNFGLSDGGKGSEDMDISFRIGALKLFLRKHEGVTAFRRPNMVASELNSPTTHFI